MAGGVAGQAPGLTGTGAAPSIQDGVPDGAISTRLRPAAFARYSATSAARTNSTASASYGTSKRLAPSDSVTLIAPASCATGSDATCSRMRSHTFAVAAASQ